MLSLINLRKVQSVPEAKQKEGKEVHKDCEVSSTAQFDANAAC